MSNKVFYGIIAILAAVLIGYIVISGSSKSPEKLLGTQYPEEGTSHVAQGTQINYKTNPPTSGSMYEPTIPKGFYEQEVPEGSAVHSLEHGYVWITYKPDLPKDQVQKLKGLFSQPFSDSKFTPSKAIVSLRSKNTAPISIVSWRWKLDLQSYDEQKLKQFYLQRVSKAPEGATP